MLSFRKKCHLISKYYIPILLVALIATAIGGFYASKLTLQSDLSALLPDTFESVKALNRIKEEVGGVGQLQILVETKDYSAARNFIEVLGPRLLASPLINYVDYKNDVQFYKKNALLFLEPSELDSLYTTIKQKIDAEKQKLNPLYVEDLFGESTADNTGDDLAKWEAKYRDKEPKEYYINADSTVLVMKIFPAKSNTDLNFVRKMIHEVEDIIDATNYKKYAPGMKIYYGGNFENRLVEYESVKKDIIGTAAYGFGGVFLLIIIYFRRLLGAILITVTLLFSLAWTFGVTYGVIGELNTITGFLFVILFGMGIDYGIHAFGRYSESRRAGLDFEQSIEKLVCQTGKALSTTAVTTSAAFFSLTLMDFKGFSDLGFIAGVGMLFALVAMVVVLPAFITLFEKLHILKVKPVPGKTLQFKRKQFRYAKPILLLSGLLTLLAIYSLSQVGFEYDFTNLRATTEEQTIVREKIRGVFKLSDSPAVVLANTDEEVSEIVEAVKHIIATDTVSPTIKAVRSVFSLVPKDQPEKLIKMRKIRELIDTEADGVLKGEDKKKLDKLKQYLQVNKPFTWAQFPAKDKRQFINKKGEIGKFVFIYPGVPLSNGRNAIDFRNDVETFTTKDGKVFHASSSNIILADMLIIMIREGRIAVVLTFCVVFVIVLLDFRSIKSAVMVLSPLVVGILWMGLVMYATGMKFNLFNIVVIPSVIGIGVDNGVHIYHRYLEEGPGSLYFVLKNTGLAILMTTTTTIVGYSGLILAHHPGLNSIGDLAVIGILSTFLTAIVVLPALIQSFETFTPMSKS